MNEATCKDAKDNPEKTSGSLEEAKTKLKEELDLKYIRKLLIRNCILQIL